MADVTASARAFFDAIETGKGWAGSRQWCTPDATFASQAEPLADITTLEAYAEWMKGLLGFIPDGSYTLKAFATDPERDTVIAYAVFTGTHTGPGGPCPPTGKSTASDYVYSIQFRGGKIVHMTKIWNSNWAIRELGWA